jgi:hypothetical protein
MTYSPIFSHSNEHLDVCIVCKYVGVLKSVFSSYLPENWNRFTSHMLIKLLQEQVKLLNYFLSIKLCGKIVVYYLYLDNDCVCTAEHNFLDAN